MKIKWTFLIFILCITSSFALKPSQVKIPITGKPYAPLANFDKRMVTFLKRWKLPGAAVAVMRQGHLVYARGFGWADIHAHQPVQPNSLFRIASVSKMITAISVLYLVQHRRLRLNDKVFRILNDLKPVSGKRVDPRLYKMTVLNLLQMSSGWHAKRTLGFDPMFGPWPRHFIRLLGTKPPAYCEMTTRVMMGFRLRANPGRSFSYSNLDYCILGLIVNKVTGYPYGPWGYAEYIKEHILSPLGIYNMQIGSTEFRNRAPGEVIYYRFPLSATDAKGFKPAVNLPYSPNELLRTNYADGGWIASAVDLVRLVQALEDNKILSNKMLRVMLQRPSYLSSKTQNYYTMGWKVRLYNGRRYLISTGSFTGTNAMVIYKPNGTIVAIIFNARTPPYTFFKRFRPKLRQLLMSVHV